MLHETDIRTCFANKPTHLVDLVLQVREQLQTFLPDHDEEVRWGRLVLYVPGAKTSVKDSICSFSITKNRLEFILHLGSLLDDPLKLLKGDFRYKRIIILKKLEDFSREGVQNLVMQSYHLDRQGPLYEQLPSSEAYSELKRGI
ncbi:MAG: DUF1801 domain-containing protein [Opitutales bacterium]|nr:DUF1801 domain-containing protein [Opitutales bacterium]